MITLTNQEKTVLTIVGAVILLGSSAHWAMKKYPQLEDIIHFIDSDQSYHKTDVNTASYDDLIAIPYIGPYTAQQIITHREKNGPWDSLLQLKEIKGIRESNYRIFSKYLKVSPTKSHFCEEECL